jgi:hypothetical protein
MINFSSVGGFSYLVGRKIRFSLCSEVEVKKIILEKIDEKQLLDPHHHQAEGELVDLRIAGG